MLNTLGKLVDVQAADAFAEVDIATTPTRGTAHKPNLVSITFCLILSVLHVRTRTCSIKGWQTRTRMNSTATSDGGNLHF